MLFSSLKLRFKCLLLKLLHAKNPGCKISGGEALPLAESKLSAGEKELSFAHVGGVGDILFSLYFCRDFARHFEIEKIRFFIVAGKNALPLPAAEFLSPLLEKQEFIKAVHIVDSVPENAVFLDDYRKLKINFSAGDIRSWYYNLTELHLPGAFWEPVIFAEPDFKYQDKIFINLTPRYRNVHIDCKQLEKYRHKLSFLGLPAEYEAFCREFFETPFVPCENMLVMAKYMAGCRGFVGNQSGIYSLAECMKIPRILLAPDFVDHYGVIVPGPHNNHPQGGWCEDVISTGKMLAAIEALLEQR